jgi:hypothetical protein
MYVSTTLSNSNGSSSSIMLPLLGLFRIALPYHPSTPIMWLISLKTQSQYKPQMASDHFTLKLFDFLEKPFVIHQLLESQVISS